MSPEEAQHRILELEEQNRNLQNTVHKLEKEILGLTQKQQEVWRQGYEAGRQDSPKESPVELVEVQSGDRHLVDAAQAPSEPVDAPSSKAFETTVAFSPDARRYEDFQSNPDQSLFGGSLTASGDYSPWPAHDGEASESLEPAPVQSQPQPVAENKPVSPVGAWAAPPGAVQSAPNQSTLAQSPPMSAGTASPQPPALTVPSAPVPPVPTTAAHLGSQSATGPLPSMQAMGGMISRDSRSIYNAVQNSDLISRYNPLAELSWNDLETVYNFSTPSIRDHAHRDFSRVNTIGDAAGEAENEPKSYGLPSQRLVERADQMKAASPALQEFMGTDSSAGFVDAPSLVSGGEVNPFAGPGPSQSFAETAGASQSVQAQSSLSQDVSWGHSPEAPNGGIGGGDSDSQRGGWGSAAAAQEAFPGNNWGPTGSFGVDDYQPMQAANQSSLFESQQPAPSAVPQQASFTGEAGTWGGGMPQIDPLGQMIESGSGFADSAAPIAPSRAAKTAWEPLEQVRSTSEHMQALQDPRVLDPNAEVVDLDALDIFDDLDDYIDLDKINVIPDVVVEPDAAQGIGGTAAAGDELRELIKGRIKQASELQHEAAAPMKMAPPQGQDKAEDKGGLGGAKNKFIGSAKAGQEPPPKAAGFMVKNIPADIRRAAMILGIRAEDMTRESIIAAWKGQIAAPGVHPDLGGDTEAAVFLNIAKDTLVRWVDQQAPKLGKKFGHKDKDKEK